MSVIYGLHLIACTKRVASIGDIRLRNVGEMHLTVSIKLDGMIIEFPLLKGCMTEVIHFMAIKYSVK